MAGKKGCGFWGYGNLNSKKGIMDNFLAMIQTFSVAILLVIVLFIFNSFNSDDLNEKLWDVTTEGRTIKGHGDSLFNQMDNLFMLGYFGIHIGLLALAYFQRSNQVVLALVIMASVLMALIAAPLSNAFDEFISDDTFSTERNEVNSMVFILANLPLFEIIWLFLTGIALVLITRRD